MQDLPTLRVGARLKLGILDFPADWRNIKIHIFLSTGKVSISTGLDFNVNGVPMEELLQREEDIELASRSLKAMAHPLRLKVLCILGGDELSVQEIVDAVGTSQSNISQHLAILRDKSILKSRKDANKVYYSINDPRTLRLISMMQQVFCSCEK
ncbi:metalloregulator ArsR/SmtB family transcription factor [Thermithiobacillus plumbiphilus]|uniref:Metalloregulator ArsR/SmtB family transcription factor n=1 Tax=Thermithiobacillus plumbiphilus TaxID=1729899 RepID=A0ABU9DBI8_9PROT